LIAVARKFIILDVSASSPQKIAALALVTLSLGAGLWFLRGYYVSELPLHGRRNRRDSHTRLRAAAPSAADDLDADRGQRPRVLGSSSD